MSIRTIVRVLTALALLAALAWPSALVADAAIGRDMVNLQNVTAAEDLEFKRLEFEDSDESEDPESDEFRQAVIEIYGQNPTGTPERYLWFEQAHVIEPEELPGLTLVESTEDHYPVQSVSVLQGAKFVSLAALAAFLLLFVGARLVPAADA